MVVLPKIDLGVKTHEVKPETIGRVEQAADAIARYAEAIAGREFHGRSGVVLHWEHGQVTHVTPIFESTLR